MLVPILGAEKKSDAAILKVAIQTADYYEVAIKELSRPEIDRAWSALATQKKVLGQYSAK